MMMKINTILIFILLIGFSLFFVWCEKWEEPNYPEGKDGIIPTISRIEPPDSAIAGVNYVTVFGTNFSASLDSNMIYFDNLLAENISGTDSSVTVLRPNIIGDSITVKVLINDALVVAKWSPYKITSVYSIFGDFLEDKTLQTASVDADDNLYIGQFSPNVVFKITPEGEKTVIADSLKTLRDTKVGPNNKLICMARDTIITAIDLSSGEETIWAYIDEFSDGTKRSEKVDFGDFDQNGYFYTSGNKSGLYVKAPGDSIARSTDSYWNNKVECVRVYYGYLYMLSDGNIIRHEIVNNQGNLNPTAETVLNWADTGEFSAAAPLYFTFSSAGRIFIGTDHTDPILVFDPESGVISAYYKTILAPEAPKLVWTNGNILYMIQEGEDVVLRIDTGETGAPYYGRQ